MTDDLEPIPSRPFTIEDMANVEGAPDWLQAMLDKPWYKWGELCRMSAEAGWPLELKVCCMCRARGIEGFEWTEEDLRDSIIVLRGIPIEHAITKERTLMYAGECPKCSKVHYAECAK